MNGFDAGLHGIVRAHIQRLSVPARLVATKSWPECVATCGLCSVAVYRTTSTPRMHLRTTSRSVIDPTVWVNADVLMSSPIASSPSSVECTWRKRTMKTGQGSASDEFESEAVTAKVVDRARASGTTVPIADLLIFACAAIHLELAHDDSHFDE